MFQTCKAVSWNDKVLLPKSIALSGTRIYKKMYLNVFARKKELELKEYPSSVVEDDVHDDPKFNKFSLR